MFAPARRQISRTVASRKPGLGEHLARRLQNLAARLGVRVGIGSGR